MFSSEAWLANPGANFYNDVATQSLRFDDDSSTYLTKTFGSDGTGSGATCTISCWVKRNNISNNDQWFFTAGASSPAWLLGFRTADTLAFGDDDGNPTVTVTDRVFRDTSAWYHIVLRVKTSESANADKYKIYVNGELQATTFSGSPADTLFGANVVHNIGRYPTGSTYVDLYMSELNFVDGLALDASYFGETKNGVWIPKEPDVSEYGTNGFRLKFDQVGVGTASTSTIGADTSGKTNHFTSSGIVASDCAMPDSPENNFCTLNPNARGTTNVALSEGNLKFVKSGANFGNVLGTMPLFSGKWYCEAYITSSNLTQVGVQEVTNNIYTSSGDFGANTDLGMWDSRGYYYDEGTAGGSPPTYTTGDIINIAFDVDAGKIWFGKNNTYNHSGDPANGTNQTTGSTNDLSSIGVTIAGNGESGGTAVYNCGQDGSFAGNKTAQGNTDDNDIGDFYYAPPSGFLALCSANLPEPTISPNADTQADDHFNTVLYSGTGSSQAITGVGFQPDWVWTKGRSVAYSHYLFDSSRGVQKRLMANSTNAEDTLSNGLTAFGTDGFTHGGEAGMGNNGDTFVAWNWKANGGTTTTNDASATSIGSQDSVYQANTTAGFSIVTYTGTGSNDTFAHGVQVNGVATAPKFIIFKRTDSAQQWVIYHEVGTGNTRSMLFNTDAPNSASAVNFNNTSPTSTVFSLGTDAYANGSGGTYVAYCFAEVEGYSKIGKFIGGGGTDGTFIFTGFQPQYLLFTNHTSGYNWVVKDGVTSPINVRNHHLVPDLPQVEGTFPVADFVSNGFKMRHPDRYFNGSGETYQFLAIGGNPFKYGNAI